MNVEAYNLDSLRNQDQAEAHMYGYFFRAQLMRPLRESLDLRCWKRELNL